MNPVLRGSLFGAKELRAHPTVTREFGFVAANVLSFEDVYAGKLVAALDRQHPRDLFDVKLLLDDEGISDRLFRAFLAYLVGHKGSIPDVLDPLGKKVDLEGLYRGQFERMTVEPVLLDTLLETRARLSREVHERLDDGFKQFLLSVQKAKPEWNLLGVEGAENLPAVKWRMVNIGRMKPDALGKEVKRLEQVLERP